MNEWAVPRLYLVGEHVVWDGVRLICTCRHYAGEAARHPWDPGDGWSVARAASLWAPNGPIEATKLVARARGRDQRLRDVIEAATGEVVER